MSLDLLDTPLRVTWDLFSGDDCLSATELRRIAVRLGEGGVFFVTLQSGAARHAAIEEIVAVLTEGSVQVSLVARPAEVSALGAGLNLADLFIDAGGWLDGTVADEELEGALGSGRDKGFSPSLTAVPLASRLVRLPDLLAFCAEHGVGRLKLPNISADGSLNPPGRADLPTPGDFAELREAVSDPASLRHGVALEVHDLFLWEILSRGDADRGEFGGCQAANSLAHVDARGDVTPCSSWPLRLGSLRENSLMEIWQGELRHRVRQDIAHLPDGCAGCRDLPLCFGGCRGLATVFGDRDARDPGCAGRR